jgi:predicted transcriptional regulator
VQGGQSRIPVMEESIDNIIGVLYAKDLLRVVASHQSPATVKRLVRPAYFVPESKRLDDLLRELQQQRVHMAIVVDEYGSVAGLVTIEDVVEEIIGDIQDEYDREEQLIEQVGENEFIVDAKISLDEFNELLDLKLTSEEYETLGGFMFAQLDKIPTVGDVVRHQNLTMTVLGTKGRRITKVRVVRHAPDESGPAEADTSQSGLAAPNGSTPTSQPGLDGIAPEVTAPSDDGLDGNDLGRFDSPGDDESTDHRLPSVGYADMASDDGVAPSRTSRARSSATRRHPHGPPQSRRR